MRENEIKKDNQKAIGKFLLIIFAAMIVGGIIGGVCSYLNYISENTTFLLTIESLNFLAQLTNIITIIGIVIFTGICFLFYINCKKKYVTLSIDEEDQIDEIEQKITFGLTFSSIQNLFLFLMFSVNVFINTLADMEFFQLGVGIILFFIGQAFNILLQQKYVDFEKKLNPEKNGSVYQMKFSKIWTESCDEAEKKIMHECAYKAFSIGNITCLILWDIALIGMMFFNTGFLPIICILIILGVQQGVYLYSNIKMTKFKNK